MIVEEIDELDFAMEEQTGVGKYCGAIHISRFNMVLLDGFESQDGEQT